MISGVIIFDLDGTIALCNHRRHFVEGLKKDWKNFFAACVNDTPNDPVIELMRELGRVHPIIILSGRSEEVKPQTVRWLMQNKVYYDYLFMRPAKDYTPDEQLKLIMLKQAQANLGFADQDVMCIFDDRQKVVDMWRKNGFACFQVADGNF